jgi:glutaredoxin-related protein
MTTKEETLAHFRPPNEWGYLTPKERKVLYDCMQAWSDIENKELLQEQQERLDFELEMINLANSEANLKEFKHYPLVAARFELEDCKKQFYEVITINGTFANATKTDVDYDPLKPSPDFETVHKNKYIFNTEQLVAFIHGTHNVAEDIILITPIKPQN